MTHSASEVFTMQLARAAAKQANRFLRSRGLQKSDRDDVIAAAMLWCWEHRDQYSLTTTLETWFMNAVRDAYKNMRRAGLPTAGESLALINGGDTTYNSAAAESSAKVLIDALTKEHKTVALATMKGYTRAEMMARGVSKRTIDEAHQRIKQLHRLLPEQDALAAMSRSVTPRAPNLDELDELDMHNRELSGIDIELEQLEFAPPAGKDCPPCWRCMWFEGFMPAGKRSTRMDIEDLEVREAVKNTEARKIEIAQQVRNGL
jgi:DNA-directed RNA polymerase specialized sigma24 family protein